MTSNTGGSGPDEKTADAVPDDAVPDAPTSDESVTGCEVVADNEQNRDGKESKLPFSKARCIALVATVTGASFMNTLGIQAVVIILPTIGRDLDIPSSRLQWIVSSYTLTFGCFLLFWGRIGDIFGKRKIFIWGSIWLAVATAICPFLPNEIAFNLFRGLQGVGAAANVPTALGILGTTFPPGKAKNYAFTVYAAGAPLGSVFGNLLAGFIAGYASWKWVFGATAMMAAVVPVAAILVIPRPKLTPHQDGASARASVDWLGAILITLGLFALLFALTEGNVVGWRTPWVSVLIVVSLILVALFALWQLRLEKGGKRAPLMKVSIFRSGQFSAAMVIMALFFSSFNGFLVFATFFYQNYQGLSTVQTTLRFIPTGVSGIITAAIVSQLLSRIPTYMILIFGNVCVSISSLLFAIPIPSNTSYFAFGLPAMILSVFGADTTWPSLTLFTSHALPQEDQAMGGALVNSMGQVGRSIGLAIATAIQTAVLARERGMDVEDAGPLKVWDEPSLLAIRAASWFHFALGVASLSVVAIAFRGSGIVGKGGEAKREQLRTGAGEEATTVEEEGRRIGTKNVVDG